MMKFMSDKYTKTKLPTPTQALEMALIREHWAKLAIEHDQLGSAREFELTALLLRYFRDHQNCIKSLEKSVKP